MKRSIFFLLTALLIMCTGCHKCEKIKIEGWLLPKELNKYLPYEVGQNVVFMNEKGDSMVFKVAYTKLLDYDTAYFSYTTNSCRPTGGVYPDYPVSLVYQPETPLTYGVKRLTINFSGTAYGEKGQYSHVSFFLISDLYDRQTILSSKGFEGDIAILSDTIPLYYHIESGTAAIVVKNKGLTSFYDTQTECKWTLQE